MSDTSLVFNVIGRDRGVNSLLARTAANVRGANAAAAAATVGFGAALASAAAHAVAFGASAAAAVGAVGLLPAVVASAALTIGAASAVTAGLGDAWKATGQKAAAGGSSATGTAQRVALAHREVRAATMALADAQRAALAAQEAVTRARADEVERLDDLGRAAAGAALDEERAVMALAESERDLIAARRSGSPRAIQEADFAYRQAQQTLDEVRDRVGDLGREQTEAARDGVEGSDAVQGALQRQADAQRAVTQAAERLADAQNAVREASAGAAAGGIDPAAEALARLSPAGRDVILTLRALVPGWQAAARAGQQATFTTVAGTLRDLSGIYLPRATSWLTRMGGSFNTAIRSAAGLAQTRDFVADVDLVLSNTAGATDRLARAVRPILNAFTQWAAVGSSFLPGLASSSLSIAQRFERWSIAARESGRMTEWIGNALSVLRSLGNIAGNVVGSIVAIFKAGDDGGSTLAALERGSAALRGWLESAQGQERVASIFATLRQILTGIANGFANADAPASGFFDALSVGGVVVSFLADHLDTLAAALPYLAGGYLLVKTAQVGANVASVASVPVQIAQVIANRRLATAISAQTAALVANRGATATAMVAKGGHTAATVAGDAATKRSIASMAAQKIAMVASAVATKAVTAAQWLWNIAMMANPIGLIILGVVALIAGIVLLWKNSETFRMIVTTAFNAVWGAIKFVWEWARDNWPLLLAILTGPIGGAVLVIVRNWDTIKAGAGAVVDFIVNGFNRVVGFVTNLPGRMNKAASGLWNGIWNGFKGMINRVIAGWNNLSFTVGGGSIAGVSIPSLTLHTPNLPMLARGGTVTRGGAAIVGDGGEPEVVTLPTGAEVTPLSRVPAAAGGAGGTVRVIVLGGDRDAVAYFRRLMAQYGF